MSKRSNDNRDANSQPVVSLASDSFTFRERLESLNGRLLQRLQTTLVLEDILEIFAEEIRHLIAFQRMTYHHSSVHLEIGVEKSAGRHQLDYNLNLQGMNLGNLRVQRSFRFQEPEIAAFETLVGALIYPLRNATLYREAQLASLTDALTGAANKRALDYQLNRDVSLAKREQTALSALVLDIDHFKRINDGFGHAAGDSVLKSVVESIKANCRDSDTVFRSGGEEFVVLLANAGTRDAMIIAERIREAVAAYSFQYNGENIPVTLSIGCSTYTPNETGSTFIERADRALYLAKKTGRNKTCIDEVSAAAMTEEAPAALVSNGA